MTEQNTGNDPKQLLNELGQLPDDALDALFSTDTVQPPNQQQAANTGVTPQHQEPQNASPAPATGQADELMSIVPEKFRDKDVKAAVGKVVKSYSELETQLGKQAQELGELRKKVAESAAQPPMQSSYQPPAPPPDEPLTEEDNAPFIGSRKELKEIVQLEAAKMALRVNQAVEQDRQKAAVVDAFRREHQDFDAFRNEMVEVIKAYPQLNWDPNGLPRIYEMAKNLAQRRFQAMGVQVAQPQAQTSAPAPAAEPVKSKDELKREIIEELKAEALKRRSAQGVSSGGVPISPQSRTSDKAPQVKPEDALFEAIKNSGPQSMKIG